MSITWPARRVPAREVVRPINSGTAHYRLNEGEVEYTMELDVLDARLREEYGGSPPVRAWVEAAEELRQRQRLEEHTRTLTRQPGWRAPDDLRQSWPLYRNEAVTVMTDWGAVTVGRSLARIYDMDGWPDAATLEAMAAQQAAQAGASYAAR